MPPLEPEKIDQLRGLIQSSGWRNVMRPSILQRATEMNRALRLNTADRREAGGQFMNSGDSELRAGIAFAEWWIAAFENEVKADNINRAKDELDRADGELTANP